MIFPCNSQKRGLEPFKMPNNRVHIRIATPEDAQTYDNYMKGIFQERLPTLIPSRHSAPLQLSEVEKFISQHDGTAKSVLYLAFENSEIAGTAHLTSIERKELDHTVTLGLNVKKGLRGRRIGSALLRNLMDWAKKKTAIERIELEVLANNQHAISMYEKVGFVKEGVKKSAVKKSSEYIDIIIMGIILRK